MSQGKLYVRAVAHSGTINALIVPAAVPEEWYFMPFPTREVMEGYATDYDLEIVEGQAEDEDDSST